MFKHEFGKSFKKQRDLKNAIKCKTSPKTCLNQPGEHEFCKNIAIWQVKCKKLQKVKQKMPQKQTWAGGHPRYFKQVVIFQVKMEKARKKAQNKSKNRLGPAGQT